MKRGFATVIALGVLALVLAVGTYYYEHSSISPQKHSPIEASSTAQSSGPSPHSTRSTTETSSQSKNIVSAQSSPTKPSSASFSSLGKACDTVSEAQAFPAANAYLISKMGQDYFSAHYKPIACTITPGFYAWADPKTHPSGEVWMPPQWNVYYDYTIGGITYNAETINGPSRPAAVTFMFVVLNGDDTKKVLQSGAVFDTTLTSIISANQAASILKAKGIDNFSNLELTFGSLPVGVLGEATDWNVKFVYRAQIQSCGIVEVDAVSGAVSGPRNDCYTHLF